MMVVSRMPDRLRADLERRSLLRGEQRLVRTRSRQARRASRSARMWAGVAVLTPGVAVVEGTWGWLVVGAGALARAGLSWRQSRLSTPPPTVLPLPTAPLPSRLMLRGSAAAKPLYRGEAAMTALGTMLRALPAGPAAATVRAAMVPAAEVVDGLRFQAARVLACESAARAVADGDRRAEITRTLLELVGSMNAAVEGLDSMLAAASDLLASASASALALGPVGSLERQTASLRGFADGLRELMR